MPEPVNTGESLTQPVASESNATPAAPTREAAIQKYSLGECLEIARTNQPTLKAAQQSLAAAQAGLQSLCNIHKFTTILAPEIPTRRQQAQLGVIVAEAEVQKVHQEINYDVSRLYWSFVYARQQQTTADDVITLLDEAIKNAKRILDAGVPDPKGKLNTFSVYALEDTLDDVRKKRVLAVTGQQLALAALKEAMGVEQTTALEPRDTELPVMKGKLVLEEVVRYAIERRPELIQASTGLVAFQLEATAQSQRRFTLQVPTFAAGSDIHSRTLPQPVRNGEYRPGAISPEMPSTLVGRRKDRTLRASVLAGRQESLYEKSLNLVKLEATNTYLSYQSATDRLELTQARYESAKKMVEQARLAAVASQDPELVFRSEALAGKAQAEYLEAVFEHIKVLTALERVTGGAVHPAYPGR
ncbi:MAG: TolC family protein [Bacteroidales bacterium]|nr:TolC family protein [Bacteroidales bacterium]